MSLICFTERINEKSKSREKGHNVQLKGAFGIYLEKSLPNQQGLCALNAPCIFSRALCAGNHITALSCTIVSISIYSRRTLECIIQRIMRPLIVSTKTIFFLFYTETYFRLCPLLDKTLLSCNCFQIEISTRNIKGIMTQNYDTELFPESSRAVVLNLFSTTNTVCGHGP